MIPEKIIQRRDFWISIHDLLTVLSNGVILALLISIPIEYLKGEGNVVEPSKVAVILNDKMLKTDVKRLFLHLEDSNDVEEEEGVLSWTTIHLFLSIILLAITLLDKFFVLKYVGKYKIKALLVEKLIEYEVQRHYGFDQPDIDTRIDNFDSSSNNGFSYYRGKNGQRRGRRFQRNSH